ncbi:hypothetical protein YPPY66_3334, partial [Yersinia pestis PY-66]
MIRLTAYLMSRENQIIMQPYP